jgi:hypothetical protein
MSLDKWLKPDEKNNVVKKETGKGAKKPVEKKSRSHQLSEEKEVLTPSEKTLKEISKYSLTCSKCKYKKIILKKRLSEKDKICPKCKGIMKFKNI